MELIILLALVFGAVVLRKQHVRIKQLEQSVSSLRASLEDAAPVQIAAAYDEPSPSADTTPIVAAIAEDEDAQSDDAAAGPWAQAARRQTEPDATIGASSPSDETEPTPVAVRPDLETALGTRWAVWIGGLALALGGVFLVRYSIEAGIFGPGVRLTGAFLFGLLLAAGGEIARRRGFQSPVAGVNSAYVPAILTAASAFTLFAAVYAAHGIYGFIGPTFAFLLLALVALGTIGASLVHGQALAGLGLLGSYLTPVLVASEAPSIWTLFLYVALVQVAAIAVASLRGWKPLATAAVVGAGLWSLVYLHDAVGLFATPVIVSHLAGLAAIAGIWLARDLRDVRVDVPSLAAAIFLYLVATYIARGWDGAPIGAGIGVAILLAAALAVAAWRARATPLLHGAALATLSIAAWPILGGNFDIDVLYGRLIFEGVWLQSGEDPLLRYSLLLAVLFLTSGIALVLRAVAASPIYAAQWAFWAAVVPLAVLVTTWLTLGNLDVDWRFALASLLLSGVLAASAEFTGRAERLPQTGGWAVSFLVAGVTASFCLALLCGFGSALTTILTGLAAAIPAAISRTRSWPALGWSSVGFAFVALARIGVDPTIVGADFLSVTPVFNVLAPGFFIPAIAFGYAAWQLARTTNAQPRLAMEAFCALFVLMGAAMLVRHAMNGGVIDANDPTLAEQAIYTLIMIGGGAILLALDQRSPSPVFRWGSIALGVVSVFGIATTHLSALNPLWTNESTGTIPVFNLLLLAYLFPAAGLAAFAWRALGRRPGWYVKMLAAVAAILGFAYVTLSIRRVFHGEFIGAWKGMGAVETYTYSAVWLLLGVALLWAGLRFGSRALRLGSAILVVIAVAKVFLYDMRELEGVLRALSFMGLGGVLIGIGMFYQRMLLVNRKAQ
jgi:uncharacterized membrane protein